MRRILALILTVMILLSYNAVAYAADFSSETAGMYSGDIAPSTEEEVAYLQSLSEAELKEINKKISDANEYAKTPTPRAVTKISIPGTFTMYQQETSYYCVPACVKSVLKYLTGITRSQNSIAKDMETTTNGTPNANIAPYLNENQDFYYVRTTYPSESTMGIYLYSTIAGHGTPALMSIANPTAANWHYATNGHRLVVNAIYSDKSIVQFADPLGGMESDWPYFYLKTSAVANSVCRDIVW